MGFIGKWLNHVGWGREHFGKYQYLRAKTGQLFLGVGPGVSDLGPRFFSLFSIDNTEASMNRSSREDAASVRNLFVMAVNLNNAAQYNGCKGVVVNYSNERFRVRLKGTFLKVKACNVVICSEAPSPFTRDEALAVLKTIGKCTDMTNKFGTSIRSLLDMAQFAVECINMPDTVSDTVLYPQDEEQ